MKKWVPMSICPHNVEREYGTESGELMPEKEV
jgi:hypothetical protein